ncbi:MAG: F0F1 ATP synthase subunit B [Acutalibacteraceae bacterium]
MNISAEMIADLVINIISVLVLVLVVTKLAYKPVKKFMDARTERVTAEKNRAEEALKLANEKEEKYNSLLEKSKEAEEEAVRNGEATARAEASKIIDTAEKKAEQILLNAQKKADEKYKKSVEDAKEEIVSLSINMSEKILSREITDDDNKKIVNDFLNSLEG